MAICMLLIWHEFTNKLIISGGVMMILVPMIISHINNELCMVKLFVMLTYLH